MKSITIINPSKRHVDKFRSGDVAISRVNVRFTSGVVHSPGLEILVTESTKAYYNICAVDYDKKDYSHTN